MRWGRTPLVLLLREAAMLFSIPAQDLESSLSVPCSPRSIVSSDG